MANKNDLSISVITQGLKTHSNSVLDSIDAAVKYANQLLDAQDAQNDIVWGRILYGLADTEISTLTVDATAKTVSCLSGAGLFANFRIGRDVQLASFTNAGNLQTTEITSKPDDDTIGIGNASGLVNETDTTSRVMESPTLAEKDVVADINTMITTLKELGDALDNAAVTTADRRDVIADWIW